MRGSRYADQPVTVIASGCGSAVQSGVVKLALAFMTGVECCAAPSQDSRSE